MVFVVKEWCLLCIRDFVAEDQPLCLSECVVPLILLEHSPRHRRGFIDSAVHCEITKDSRTNTSQTTLGKPWLFNAESPAKAWTMMAAKAMPRAISSGKSGVQ